LFLIIISNLKSLFITWTILLLANQLFIFGSCFAPNCLVAALPHTGIISLIIIYLLNKPEDKRTEKQKKDDFEDAKFMKELDNEIKKEEEDMEKRDSYLLLTVSTVIVAILILFESVK